MSVPQARDAHKKMVRTNKGRGADDDEGSRTALSGGGGSKTGRGGAVKGQKCGRSGGGGGGGGGGDKRGRARSDDSDDTTDDSTDDSSDDDGDDDDHGKKLSRVEGQEKSKKKRKKRKKEKKKRKKKKLRQLKRRWEQATAKAQRVDRWDETQSDSSADYGGGAHANSDDGKQKKIAKKEAKDPNVTLSAAIIDLKQVFSDMGQRVGAGWLFRNGLYRT